MPARSFGPFTSDGIPVPAGARVQLRVIQTSGVPRNLAKLRFGVAQLEPKGSGGLLLPGVGGGGGAANLSPAFPWGGPVYETGQWIALGGDSDVVFSTDTEVYVDDTLPGGVYALLWGEGGTRLFAIHLSAPYLRVYDTATGEIESGWPTVSGNAWNGALSPDGTKLAVSHDGGTNLSIIDLETKTIESGWPSFSARPFGIAWSPDGDRIAVGQGGASNGYHIIDVETKTIESGWPEASPTMAVAWSPDGTRLALSDSGLTVIDVETKTIESGWPAGTGPHGSVAWSPDGTKLAQIASGTGTYNLLVADVETKTAESGWGSFAKPLGLGWAADGQWLAVTLNNATAFRVLNTDTKTHDTGWDIQASPPAKRAVSFAYDPGNTSSG